MNKEDFKLLSSLNNAKLKKGILSGPQITNLLDDTNFVEKKTKH